MTFGTPAGRSRISDPYTSGTTMTSCGPTTTSRAGTILVACSNHEHAKPGRLWTTAACSPESFSASTARYWVRMPPAGLSQSAQIIQAVGGAAVRERSTRKFGMRYLRLRHRDATALFATRAASESRGGGATAL